MRHTADGTGIFDGIRWRWGRKLPVVLQTEAAECGLACLTMIARYHNQNIDLPSLRRIHSGSLRGVNLKQLMEIAAAMGFETRPLRLELRALIYLKTPCILHWDLNHFVVLKQATLRSATIYDPAYGVRRSRLAELSDHFTGVALECTPGADFKPIRARESISLRTLTGGVDGLPNAIVVIFALALVLEVFALVGPFYLQWVIDEVIASADKSLLVLLGSGFLLLALFQAVISGVRAWTITWLSAMLNVQWTTRAFSHLVKLPMDWYGKRHVGDVLSRFRSINTIEKTLTTDFVAAILDGMMAILTFVMLVLYSVKLALIVATAFVLYGLLRLVTFQPLKRAQEDQLVYAARQQTELMESIRGAQTLKLLSQQHARTSQYANTAVETINRQITTQRFNIAFLCGNQLIFGLEKVVVIWLAAALVLNHAFTVGMLVAFVAYAEQFVTRASSLIDKGMEFRMLRLHSERVADIALAEPEPHIESIREAPLPEASIEVRNVSFRYAENEPWILKNCSLSVRAGESIALTGPSGCGKTTLAKIILGLLTPEEGEVLFGGVDIRQLGLGRYRRHVGVVMQDDQLFAGSIAENISCFDTESSSLRIEAAARQAAIHDEILAMPMAYRTLVGDMGSALSGGQKQRILFARALYRKPALLILDEATSQLDAECEKLINSTIRNLAVTTIRIAHQCIAMENVNYYVEIRTASGIGTTVLKSERSSLIRS